MVVWVDEEALHLIWWFGLMKKHCT